ncbi:MAG TPA: CBS domain-containing protein [Chitinophagaceae bacterium]|nr:CBS domain-containing protein [Chitinophagaceae bacterium]
MLVSQIIETNFPQLQFNDKVSFALLLMDDYGVHHLAVVHEEGFAGIISREMLLEANEDSIIATLKEQLLQASVLSREHFLSAVKLAASAGDLSLVPVINESKELLGVITTKKLIHATSIFNAVEEPGGMIVLEMDRRNFSFGELSRLIETNDAYITQLNTYTEVSTGLLQVTIKVNKIEISDIIATLQRYDYNIRYYFGEELYENELKENLDLLMTYLNI